MSSYAFIIILLISTIPTVFDVEHSKCGVAIDGSSIVPVCIVPQRDFTDTTKVLMGFSYAAAIGVIFVGRPESD